MSAWTPTPALIWLSRLIVLHAGLASDRVDGQRRCAWSRAMLTVVTKKMGKEGDELWGPHVSCGDQEDREDGRGAFWAI